MGEREELRLDEPLRRLLCLLRRPRLPAQEQEESEYRSSSDCSLAPSTEPSPSLCSMGAIPRSRASSPSDSPVPLESRVGSGLLSGAALAASPDTSDLSDPVWSVPEDEEDVVVSSTESDVIELSQLSLEGCSFFSPPLPERAIWPRLV